MLRKTGRNGKRLLLPYVPQGMKRNEEHAGNNIFFSELVINIKNCSKQR